MMEIDLILHRNLLLSLSLSHSLARSLYRSKFGWNLIRIENEASDRTKRSIVNSLTQLKLNEVDRAAERILYSVFLLFSLLRLSTYIYIYIDRNFYHRVVGQHVHERSSHVPTINGVPQSPLIMVPSIEEDRVRPLLQQPIHSRGNSRYSTYATRLLPLLTRSGSGIGLLEPGKRENNFRNEESIYHPPSILSTDPPIVFDRILLSNMYR